MRNAFIGGTLVAIASGLIGYFVVIRQRRVRRARARPHRLPRRDVRGARRHPGHPRARGLLRRAAASPSARSASGVANREVSTGTILAFATGLGVLFASLASENTSTVTNVLFGNLLAISPDQIRTFTLFTVGARWSRSASSPARCSSRRSTRTSPRPRASRCGRSASCSWCCSRSPSPWRCRSSARSCCSRSSSRRPPPRSRSPPGPPSVVATRHRHRARVGVDRARARGDVQPAAELLHRQPRVRRLARHAHHDPGPASTHAWIGTGGRASRGCRPSPRGTGRVEPLACIDRPRLSRPRPSHCMHGDRTGRRTRDTRMRRTRPTGARTDPMSTTSTSPTRTRVLAILSAWRVLSAAHTSCPPTSRRGHQMMTTRLIRRGGVRSRLRRAKEARDEDGDPGFWR